LARALVHHGEGERGFGNEVHRIAHCSVVHSAFGMWNVKFGVTGIHCDVERTENKERMPI
jgi:hypothetical protein